MMLRAAAVGKTTDGPRRFLTCVADRWWAAALLLCGLVAAAYGPFISAPFIFDDVHSVVENPYIRDLGNIAELFRRPSTFSVNVRWQGYRPLLLTSFALSYALTGPESWSFRMVNFLLHAANALLVFFLLRHLIGWMRSAVPALAGAILFALHPGQTQAVMYVSSRSEVMAATFILLALLFFLRALDRHEQDGKFRLGDLAAMFLAYVMALLTKETAALFMPAAFLLGLAMMPTITPPRLTRLSLWLAPFVALYFAHSWLKRILAAAAAYSGPMPVHATASLHSFSDLLLRIEAFGVYPRLALFGYPLRIFHELPEAGQAQVVSIVVSLMLLLAFLVGAVIAFVKDRRLLAFGLAWLPAMLVPYFLAEVTMKVNENRLYLAIFGAAVIAADLLSKAGAKKPLAAGLCTALLGLYLAETVTRNRDWMDSERFWLRESAAAPGLAWPYQELALYYDRHGKTRDAMEALRQASVRKHASLGMIHNYIGVQLVRAGQLEKAKIEFLKAVKDAPATPHYLNNLGSLLDDLGERQEAERYLKRAVSLTPCFEKALFNLGILYETMARTAEAEASFRKAVTCNDYYGRAHAALGRILLGSSESEALYHLERAAELPGADGGLYYLLARARARAGMAALALAALEHSAQLGYTGLEKGRNEVDFKNLRGSPRFRHLMLKGAAPE